MASSSHLFSRMRAIGRGFLLCLLLPVCLLCGAAVGSFSLLCTFRPEIVSVKVQELLCASTGLPWQIKGDIAFTLDPFPGVSVGDVRILAASMDQAGLSEPALPFVEVESARLYLDIASMLRFSPRVRLVVLDRPTINLAYDQHKRPLWLPLPEGCEISPSEPLSTEAPLLPEAPPLPLPGTSPVEAEDSLMDILGFVYAESSGPLLPLRIRHGLINVYLGEKEPILSLTKLEARISPRFSERLRASAHFSLPAAGLEADLLLDARLGTRDTLPAGQLSATLSITPPGSRAVSGEFSTRFVWREAGREVLLPDFFMVAEGDSLSGDLRIDLQELNCTGKVNIHQLSLPRWFGFGRSLPPGLQHPLHSLLGSFDLHVDATRAEARNLRGMAGPLMIKGFVGAPDLSAPVVVVDLDLDKANLDVFFPFLAMVGKYVPDPVAPTFTHPPLAPFPADPAALPAPETGIEVGYDVTVRVARPSVHDVDGGALKVLVQPVTVKGTAKTRVSFSGTGLLEGKVDGTLDIDERSVMMQYAVHGLKLGLLPENRQNSVRIAGALSGTCDITVPLSPEGNWQDDWELKANAGIKGCAITGQYGGVPWRLYAASAKASGKGSIHSVRRNGVRIGGLWALSAQGIKTSWYPGGNDAISGKFNGALHWPPIEDAPPPESPRILRTIERRGVERIAGKLDLSGSLIIPLGSWRPPLTGKLSGELDWLLYEESVALRHSVFTGFGSIVTGTSLVDYSGSVVSVQSSLDCKIHPRELLPAWGIDFPGDVHPPKLLIGKASLAATPDSLLIDKLKLQLDGAPLSGSIAWKNTATPAARKAKKPGYDAGLWTLRLTAGHLNLGNFLPSSSRQQAHKVKKAPTTPPGPPWNLEALKSLSLDAKLILHNAKWGELEFADTLATATLQRNRFSLHMETSDFYDGKSTVLLQGTIIPESSRIILRKGLLHMQKVALNKLLYAYTGDTLYGGTADVVADLSGTLQRGGDIPAKLSGIWRLSITDGLYPTFFGDKNSTLRNTFSTAGADGLLDKGVLRWKNFRLQGAMVDMYGDGWIDLRSKDMDIMVNVTVAKVPTVPVRFYGNASAPLMRVRGVDVMLETMKAAGSTVLNLLQGVLELPGRAISGIGSLFSSDDD